MEILVWEEPTMIENLLWEKGDGRMKKIENISFMGFLGLGLIRNNQNENIEKHRKTSKNIENISFMGKSRWESCLSPPGGFSPS